MSSNLEIQNPNWSLFNETIMSLITYFCYSYWSWFSFPLFILLWTSLSIIHLSLYPLTYLFVSTSSLLYHLPNFSYIPYNFESVCNEAKKKKNSKNPLGFTVKWEIYMDFSKSATIICFNNITTQFQNSLKFITITKVYLVSLHSLNALYSRC